MCLHIKQHCEHSGQTNQVQYTVQEVLVLGRMMVYIGVVKEFEQIIHFSAVMSEAGWVNDNGVALARWHTYFLFLV